MPVIDELLKIPPFSLDGTEKQNVFFPALLETMQFHLKSSLSYRKWCESNNFKTEASANIVELPFVPVEVFKEFDLITVKENEIVDIRHSSSTSSGIPSLVKRDPITLKRYSQSRNAVLDSFCPNSHKIQIGVIEDPEKNPNRHLSANLVVSVMASRAGQGQTHYIAVNNNGKVQVDVDRFLKLLEQHGDRISLIFGHTAYIYLFLIEVLRSRNIKLNLSNTTMLFGWGWKKYKDQAVPMHIFRKGITDILSIPTHSILDMYGFAESNTLYLECSEGFRHVPLWEEVIVRCPKTLTPIGHGKEGLLQFLSPIPNSYAGSSVLVDDIGISYHGRSSCECGRKGSRFKVIRRANAEEVIALKKLKEGF